jgi:hypothetical protein
MVGRPLVKVAAAYSHIGYLDQYVLFPDLRRGDFPDFDGMFFGRVVHHCR